jgi:hypothetical protein
MMAICSCSNMKISKKMKCEHICAALSASTNVHGRNRMRMALWLVGRKLTGTDQTPSSVANLILSHPQFRPSVVPGEGFGDGTLQSLFATGNLEHMVIRLTKLVTFDPHESAIDAREALSLSWTNGKTLIHLSGSLGFYRLTEELIAHDVDLNKRDVNGFTALHYTALYGQASCARLLIDGGADRDIVDAWGRVAREVALYSHQGDVCAELDADESSPSTSDSTSHNDDGITERKDFETGETASNVSSNDMHQEPPKEAPLPRFVEMSSRGIAALTSTSRITKGNGLAASHASPHLRPELSESTEVPNKTPPPGYKPGSSVGRGLLAKDSISFPNTRSLRSPNEKVSPGV